MEVDMGEVIVFPGERFVGGYIISRGFLRERVYELIQDVMGILRQDLFVEAVETVDGLEVHFEYGVYIRESEGGCILWVVGREDTREEYKQYPMLVWRLVFWLLAGVADEYLRGRGYNSGGAGGVGGGE